VAGTAHAVPACHQASKFWPRAFRRAANLMMLTPSTGCIFQGKLEAGRAGRVVVSAHEPARRTARCVDPVGSVAVAAGPDQRQAVVALALHQRGIGRADLSAICDIEIASWTLRGLTRRRRGRRRRDARSYAVVRWGRAIAFIDAWAQVFVRPVMPYPCAATMAAAMVVSISPFRGAHQRNLEWTDQARGPAAPRSPSRNG